MTLPSDRVPGAVQLGFLCQITESIGTPGAPCLVGVLLAVLAGKLGGNLESACQVAIGGPHRTRLTACRAGGRLSSCALAACRQACGGMRCH